MFFYNKDLNHVSKHFEYRLKQIPLPHLEAIHWLTQYTATCDRGGEVVRVRARLKTKKKKHFVVSS